MVLVEEKIYTVEDYFELERNSEVKHEFVDGKLIEIPGESRISNRIAGSLYALLLRLLNHKVFEVYIEDVRLSTLRGKKYRYPDVMVVPVIDDEDAYNVYQAVLVAEVLSPSTEKTDRNDKLKEYSKMPSVQYYLLILQEEATIELYRRNGNVFEYIFFTERTEIIDLPLLNVQFSIEDIYGEIIS